MNVITPGANFCRVLTASNGQQVLVMVETTEQNEPFLVGSASFLIDGAPAIVRQAFEEIDIGQALSFEGTKEQQVEYADSVLHDLRVSLETMLANPEPHVHTAECQHGHTH